MLAIVSGSLALARGSCALSRLALRALPRAIVQLKKAGNADEDEQSRLLASLAAGMNSWSNFEDDSPKKSPTKNSERGKTKRRGKDGKVYLRDGPKRKPVVTKLAARRMSNSSSSSSQGDAAAPAAEAWRVRIEESKRTTTIRGLEAMPAERATAFLKQFKQALACQGKLHANGEIELQGAHAERVMLRLQKDGFVDVKLSGGETGAPAWNAPREIREKAEAAKRAAVSAKKASKAREREARKTPAAVAEATRRQLQRSEQEVGKLLGRSDLPPAERKAAKVKMERIQQRLAEL